MSKLPSSIRTFNSKTCFKNVLTEFLLCQHKKVPVNRQIGAFKSYIIYMFQKILELLRFGLVLINPGLTLATLGLMLISSLLYRKHFFVMGQFNIVGLGWSSFTENKAKQYLDLPAPPPPPPPPPSYRARAIT